MKTESCQFHEIVFDCLSNDCWDEEILHHVKNCPQCQETVLVAGWTQSYRDLSNETQLKGKSFLHAEDIWEKVQINRKEYHRELEDKVVRPLIIPKILSWIFSAIAIIILAVQFLPMVFNQTMIKEHSDTVLSSVQILMQLISKTVLLLQIPLMVGVGTSLVILTITGLTTRKRKYIQISRSG